MNKNTNSEDIVVPDKWDPYIVEHYNKDTPLTNSVKMIQKDLRIKKKWQWLIKNDKTSHYIIFILEMMTEIPMINKSSLLFYYLQENYGDFSAEKKIEGRIKKGLTGALISLINCDLVTTINVNPAQKGRFSCRFYIAPFAKEEDKNKAITNYMNIGGGIATAETVKKPVSEDEWAAKMAKRKKLVKEKVKLIEKALETEVAYCDKCTTEYTVKFAGERCMNCDDNFSRVSILKVKKIESDS